MHITYSNRILNTPKSFIREILKVTEESEVISFAGGLPNPISFPSLELTKSISRVIEEEGSKVFQYASTEGLLPLREFIAERYQKKHQLFVSSEDILITTGSQQGLDLMGKVLINPGDFLLLEKPGYLGAIQAFSMYEPNFTQVNLLEDGMDTKILKEELRNKPVKLIYTVPNYQNPTGLTYSLEKRQEISHILADYPAILIEDDPYGELCFTGESLPYISKERLEYGVLLGSFSKIITPGMRIGWICTKNRELMNHLVTAKQASDLHTNIFCQYILNDYLRHNNLDEHISKIRALYKEQCASMLKAIQEHFPEDTFVTKPEGGMFLWAELPESKDSMALFKKAIEKNVSFVPGTPFYTSEDYQSTLRLNYTNSSSQVIAEGIKRLSEVM